MKILGEQKTDEDEIFVQKIKKKKIRVSKYTPVSDKQTVKGTTYTSSTIV